MRGFTYHEPHSTDEACSILSGYAGSARVLAGGTDLLPKMKDGVWRPPAIVNIKGLGLNEIREQGQSVFIGALSTLSDVIESALIAAKLPLLREAACKVASIQIRNLATIGGNVCNASPSADMPPALLVLGAKASIIGPSGYWQIPLEEFFTGPGQTVLAPGDLLSGLEVPLPPERTKAVYIKHSTRQAMDLATVGVAVLVELDAQECCQACRIALGAVAPTPIRARQAEGILLGQQITAELAHEAAIAAAGEAHPIDDVRGSAAYRTRMIKVHVQRALTKISQELAV